MTVMFHILIGVVLTHQFVKSSQIVYLRSAHFTASKLYFDMIVEKRKGGREGGRKEDCVSTQLE
jgi:hypothetical protein